MKTALSLLGSFKDVRRIRAQFDDVSHAVPAESLFPPNDVRPAHTDGRTLLLRVTDFGSGEGSIFTVVHTPAGRDSISVLVFNPNTIIEADATLRELVDGSGYPVAVAIVEEFLGTRIDHVVELSKDAFAQIIDTVGPLATYSRTAFSTNGMEFAEGTNYLDGTTARVFTTAEPVDDAGQTRTRNQRATLRALLAALDVRKLAKDTPRLVQVLEAVAGGIKKDAGFGSAELIQLAGELRGIARSAIIAVTVPTATAREKDGDVQVNFEADVLEALRESLTAGSPREFVAKLAEMGY